jgi:hypothetical protein
MHIKYINFGHQDNHSNYQYAHQGGYFQQNQFHGQHHHH